MYWDIKRDGSVVVTTTSICMNPVALGDFCSSCQCKGPETLNKFLKDWFGIEYRNRVFCTVILVSFEEIQCLLIFFRSIVLRWATRNLVGQN